VGVVKTSFLVYSLYFCSVNFNGFLNTTLQDRVPHLAHEKTCATYPHRACRKKGLPGKRPIKQRKAKFNDFDLTYRELSRQSSWE